MPDSTEATKFESNNPNLIILRSYEDKVYGVIAEVFYNPDDKKYYAKGYFGAGKGDLKSFIVMPDEAEKRKNFIKNISEATMKEGGKEVIHSTRY